MRFASLVGCAVLASSSIGCFVTLPEINVKDSGKPLEVFEERREYTYTASEKVGETQTRDSNGNTVATTAVFANRQHVGVDYQWGGKQGGTKMNDDEFFAIAADPLTRDAVRSQRSRGKTMNLAGNFIGLGGLAFGIGGLALPDLLRAEAKAGLGKSRKAVIMIYLCGAPPHQDMFDLKMDAPAEIRGEFQPIETSVPGIQICEHMPRLAKIMDKLVPIRTMVGSPNGNHDSLGADRPDRPDCRG